MPINKFGTDRSKVDTMKLGNDLSLLRVRMNTVAKQIYANTRSVDAQVAKIPALELAIKRNSEDRVKVRNDIKVLDSQLSMASKDVDAQVVKTNEQELKISQLLGRIYILESRL